MTDPAANDVALVEPRPTIVPMHQHRPGVRLPASLTSFVGRDRELAEVASLLQRPEACLVTLIGPGGIGKTRLALETGAWLSATFRDGVVFVDLAQILDPAQVMPAIARALDVSESPGHAWNELLVKALLGLDLLLILDNLEHLLAAAPRLAALLAAVPTLKFLATSRSPLGIAAEWLFPVPSLAVAATPGTSPERKAGKPRPVEPGLIPEAGRLFVDRARAVRPDFALDSRSAPLVHEICRRVDGLPLGIELAAARLRHLSLASLLDELHQRLPLLTGGPSDRPPRLRTMQDAIAWSHDLLSPDEQTLFRRLAVFVGGFSLSAAEGINGADLLPEVEPPATPSVSAPGDDTIWGGPCANATLALVTSLADKSLLQVEEGAAGETRYRLLETIREFAAGRLFAAADEEATRRRHAAWYLHFAEEHGPKVKGSDQLVSLSRFAEEWPNLRAALGWLRTRGDVSGLARLAGALWPFWEEQELFADGRWWLEQALAAGPNVAERLPVLTGVGTLAWQQGDIPAATRWHEEALALARAEGDQAAEAFALNNLGVQAIEVGDYDTAVTRYEASLAVARAANARQVEVLALHNLGMIAWLRGTAPLAVRQLEASLALAREHGATWQVPAALTSLGRAVLLLDNHERAMVLFRESLEMSQARGNQGMMVDAIEGIALVGAAIGHPVRAACLLGATAAAREASGILATPMDQVSIAPTLDALRQTLGEEAFAAAWISGRSQSWEELLAEARGLASLPPGKPAPRAPQAGARHGLTKREHEVLRLLVAGHTNREIGDRLFISPTTVARHVANIYGKLGISSRAAAIAFALRHGAE